MKERPLSPQIPTHGMSIPIPSLPSPLSNIDSPIGAVVGGSVSQPGQPLGGPQGPQQTTFRPMGNPVKIKLVILVINN